MIRQLFRRSEDLSTRLRHVFSDIYQRRLATVTGADFRPSIVDMKNGEKCRGLFSAEEYENRLKRLRTYMASDDLCAVVLTSYHNINYYSGFMYCSFGRPYCLVITQDSSTMVTAGIDGGQPWRRGHGDQLTYTDWGRDNFFSALKRSLRDASGKIGMEFDHVTMDNKAKFDAVLPNHTKADVGVATMRMRMIKSQEEVDVIRQGARIADIGGAACVEVLVDGIPEYEVALASTQAMVREIAKTYPHTDIMDTWTWFQSGVNTDGAHNPVTTRRVRSGDILSLNCFPMIQGYYTALERTLFLDHASDEHLKIWEANCEVHRRGSSLIRAGARCSDIAQELNALYADMGLLQYRSFGYGHSFGTLCHYYGREAELEIREDIETILQPGMVVSMEPMIMVPESKPGAGGYREHDIFVIVEDGVHNITDFPYGPEHNIIKK